MGVYETKYTGFQARLSMISADRTVSGFRQFVELFKRNGTYLLRNPVIIRMTFVSSSFIAILVLALFHGVADV